MFDSSESLTIIINTVKLNLRGMLMNELHEMHREKTYESGAEVWVCGECERKLLIQTQPFKKEVVKPGKASIRHIGVNENLGFSIQLQTQQKVHVHNKNKFH